MGSSQNVTRVYKGRLPALDSLYQVLDKVRIATRWQLGLVGSSRFGHYVEMVLCIGAQMRRTARAHNDKARIAKRGAGLRRQPIGREGGQRPIAQAERSLGVVDELGGGGEALTSPLCVDAGKFRSRQPADLVDAMTR